MAHKPARDVDLSAMATPEQWRFVCSALPIEGRPVRNAGYDRWAATNSHRHANQEILFCFEGETLERFAGRNYRCRPGSVFLIDSNEEHANHYPRDGRSFTHLWIMGLDTGAVASLYSQRRGSVVEQRRAPVVLARAECELLARSWALARRPFPWMSDTIRRAALVSAVFAVVFRAIDHWHRAGDVNALPQRHREIISAVQSHIETHLDEAVDLDSLAHVSGYSKFHFARLFKEHSGQTVHRFVDACRMRKARELSRLHVPHKQIAGTLGFSCPAAFSNWLRKNRSRIVL